MAYAVKGEDMTDDELLSALNDLRTLMINVATGGPRINDVNGNYQRVFAGVAADLARRRIDNPITFGSLWDWYARWSSGDLPTYQSRRNFISELINPLLNRIRTGHADEQQPTGWQRVDRCVGELRDRLAAARNEEQFQTVGLLGREALISLAQSISDELRLAATGGCSDGTPVDGKQVEFRRHESKLSAVRRLLETPPRPSPRSAQRYPWRLPDRWKVT